MQEQQPQMPVQPQESQAQNPVQQCNQQWAQAQQEQYQSSGRPQQGQYQQPQPQPVQYQDPQASAPYQQPYGYAQPAQGGAYYVSDQDRTLRLIAFVFCIISLVASCWLIIPLAWMIPMCVISWGIYKGTKANTVAFAVCTLIFSSLVAGILLLISKKDR